MLKLHNIRKWGALERKPIQGGGEGELWIKKDVRKNLLCRLLLFPRTENGTEIVSGKWAPSLVKHKRGRDLV